VLLEAKKLQSQKPANATALCVGPLSGSEILLFLGARRFANSQRNEAKGVRMRLAIVPARLMSRRAWPT
jgi:hypothetical protein